MAANLERFRKDLNRLVSDGDLLELAMQRTVNASPFEKRIKDLYGDDAAKILAKLPNFFTGYEAWYSESLALLRQLLPDRVQNFVSMYEKPKGRKEVLYGNYVIQDFLQGLKVTRGGGTQILVDSSAAIPQFRQQVSILKAAKARFDSSLFEIRQFVQADLFDSELDGARELAKNKFYRGAGVIAGVILEKHLHQVCDDHALKITKKNPTIGDLSELLKTNSVIDVPQWRHISMLADLRNLCSHHKAKEPTAEQATDLIDGTNKIMKTVA